MTLANGFDGESYLRLLGERTLLTRENSPFGGALPQQARVLAMVGVVEVEVAQRIVDDYGRAAALRGIHRPGRTVAGPSAPPSPRRVVPCRRVIEQPWGELQVRYVSLGEDSSRLTAVLRLTAPGRGGRPRARGPRGRLFGGSGGPPSLTVTDDRGTSASAGFSGGGDDQEWEGRYELQPPLAADTAWIELLGERIELGAGTVEGTATVEAFDDADAVGRCLDLCLAARGHRPHGPTLSAALTALEAAGLIRRDDPLVTESLAIEEALDRSGPTTGIAREPWRSLLARHGRGGGPAGTVFAGVTTPVFDGISATLLELESDAHGFRCDFELNGRATLGGMHMGGDVTSAWVTFTAADDRGNRYLGQPGSWGSSAGRASGTLDFRPALDPKAERLDVTFTTTRARATIAVPLVWADA